jgi:hypothetical protein
MLQFLGDNVGALAAGRQQGFAIGCARSLQTYK